MNDNKEEIIKAVTNAGMISVLISLGRALIAKNEPILSRIAIIFASICFGIVTALVLRTTDLSEFKKMFLVSVFTAFGHNVWPILEKIFIKMVKRGDKINDILHSDDN